MNRISLYKDSIYFTNSNKSNFIWSTIPLFFDYEKYCSKINILLFILSSLIIIFLIRYIPGKKRVIASFLSKFLNEQEIIRIIPKKYLTQELKRIEFYQQFVNKNDLCFDVGANVGNRVETLLKIGAQVIAIEPQENCCKELNSQFGNQITIINKGLCEQKCIREFHICTSTEFEFGLSPVSSFSEEWISSCSKEKRFEQSCKWDKTIEVEMTTLDNLIGEYGVPSFIKIDVEGYELEVLSGLSHPINMISFEYTVPEQITKIEQCVKTVEKFNPDILLNFSIGESMKWAQTNGYPYQNF